MVNQADSENWELQRRAGAVQIEANLTSVIEPNVSSITRVYLCVQNKCVCEHESD